MEFPESVLAVVRDAAAKWPDDIPKAAEEAERDLRAAGDFAALVPLLVSFAVRELVYRSRVTSNVEIKRRVGPPARPKVIVGASESVNGVYQSIYDWSMGGKSLGSMTATDLLAVVEGERAIASGHLAVAEFAERVAGMVPEGQCVRQAVPAKKLESLWRKVQREVNQAA